MVSFFSKCNWTGGLVSSSGELLICGKFELNIGYPSEGIACCEQNGKLFGVTENGDRIFYDNKEKQVHSLPAFSEGLAGVRDAEKKKCGYIDKYGEWIILPRFEMAGDFRDGLAIVFDCESERKYESRAGKKVIIEQTIRFPKYGIINKKGEWLHTLPIDDVPLVQSDSGWPNDLFEFVGTLKVARKLTVKFVPCVVRNFNEVIIFHGIDELRPCYCGVVACKYKKDKKTKWQMRTTQNVLLNNDEFNNVGFWGSNLCPATVDDKKWGAIDLQGCWAIPQHYDHLRMFRHGFADGERKGRRIVISPANDVVLECKADYVKIYQDRIVTVDGNNVMLHDLRGNLLRRLVVK